MTTSDRHSSRFLEDIVQSDEPFATVKKQGEDSVSLFRGELLRLDLLQDIPRRTGVPASGRLVDSVCAIPFSQIRERGYETVRDADESILCLSIREHMRMAVQEVCGMGAAPAITLDGGVRFDSSDEDYAALVERVIRDEIGNGEGANFVIPRTAEAQIIDFTRTQAMYAPTVTGSPVENACRVIRKYDPFSRCFYNGD